MGFLPTTVKEIRALGWEAPDVILVTGDAYIDHPSFGVAVIGRLLEAEGLRVAVVPQPNWKDDLRDFRKLGAPKLFFGVTSGCMDSMVNHYTAAMRLRSNDAYTAGGEAGRRPDRAVTVYSRILKELYPHVPVVAGGGGGGGGASPITIGGTTHCTRRSLSTAAPTWWLTAWATSRCPLLHGRSAKDST